MIGFFIFVILIDILSSFQIEPSSKQLKIYENLPNGAIIGRIEIYSSNYSVTLIDNANDRFHLNSIVQLIVSFFYLFYFYLELRL